MWWRITFDSPHRMPCANQLEIMWLETPDPSKRSPSVEMMQREQESSFLRARINCQIRAIGVRDMVEPPMPTEAPSRIKVAASSSVTTFSRRLRSPRQILPQLLVWLNRVLSHYDLALFEL